MSKMRFIIPCDSKAFDKIGYEPVGQSLCVKFKNGSGSYQAEKVMDADVINFMFAENRGEFFAHVLKAKYTFVPVVSTVGEASASA